MCAFHDERDIPEKMPTRKTRTYLRREIKFGGSSTKERERLLRSRTEGEDTGREQAAFFPHEEEEEKVEEEQEGGTIWPLCKAREARTCGLPLHLIMVMGFGPLGPLCGGILAESGVTQHKTASNLHRGAGSN